MCSTLSEEPKLPDLKETLIRIMESFGWEVFEDK